MSELLSIDITVNTENLDKDLGKARDNIHDFNERVKKDEAVELSINKARLQKELEITRQLIKRAQKDGDFEAEIQFRSNANILQQQLTQANRELTNFLRTGNKTTSVLGKLFSSLEDSIGGVEEELIKMGRSEKEVEHLRKRMDSLNQEFREGKVGAKEFAQEINKIQKEAQAIQSSGDPSIGIVGKIKGGLGSLAGPLAGFAGIGASISLLQDGTRQALEFGESINRVGVVTKASREELEVLRDQVINLSNDTGIASTQLAKTAYDLAAAGIALKDIPNTLDSIARASVASGAATDIVFGGAYSVIQAYGLGIEDLDGVLDRFFQTNNLGMVSIEGLSAQIGQVAPIAKNAGVSLNELLATYATLVGVTGNESAVTTQIRSTLTNLSAPAVESKKVLDELGVSYGQNAIQAKGFTNVIKELFDATGGNLEVLKKAIPDVEALNLVLAIGSGNVDKMKTNIDGLKDSTGEMSKAFEKYTDTEEFKLRQSAQIWENYKIKAGEVMVRVGAVVLQGIEIMWGALRVLIAGMFDLMSYIPRVWLNAMIVLPGIWERTWVNIKKIGETFISAIAYNIGLIPGIVRQVGSGVVANFAKMWDNAGNSMGDFLDNVGIFGRNLVSSFTNYFSQIPGKFGSMWNSLLGEIPANVKEFLGLKQYTGGSGGGGVVKEAYKQVRSVFEGVDFTIDIPAFRNVSAEVGAEIKNFGDQYSKDLSLLGDVMGDIKVFSAAKDARSEFDASYANIFGGGNKKTATEQIKQQDLDKRNELVRTLEQLLGEDKDTGGKPTGGKSGGGSPGKSEATKQAEKEAKEQEKIRKETDKRLEEYKDKKKKRNDLLVDHAKKVSDKEVEYAKKVANAIEQSNKKLEEQRAKLQAIQEAATEAILDIEDQQAQNNSEYRVKLAERLLAIKQELITADLSTNEGQKLEQERAYIEAIISRDEIRIAQEKANLSEAQKLTNEYREQNESLEKRKQFEDALANNRFKTNESGQAQLLDEQGNVLTGPRDLLKEFSAKAKQLQDIAKEEERIEIDKMKSIQDLAKQFIQEKADLEKSSAEKERALKLAARTLDISLFQESMTRLAQQKAETLALVEAYKQLQAAQSATGVTYNTTNTTNNNQPTIVVKQVADIKSIDSALGKNIAIRTR